MAEQGGTGSSVTHSDKDFKSPNLIKHANEEIGSSPRHDKETHGKSDNINENTPVEEVKGPSVIQRAKEEIEAVVGSILPKK